MRRIPKNWNIGRVEICRDGRRTIRERIGPQPTNTNAPTGGCSCRSSFVAEGTERTGAAEAAQGFAEELTGPERLPYTLAIHKGGGENPHIHLMISERGLDGHDRDAEQWFKRANTKEPDKGGAKKTSLSSKEWLADTRQRWETAANRALDRAGSAERIDHRSLAAQREEAIERGQVERAAELSRTPRNVPGPEAHRAERGGPSRVVEVAERSERSNTRPERSEPRPTAQVDRAAAVFRERSEQMKAQFGGA